MNKKFIALLILILCVGILIGAKWSDYTELTAGNIADTDTFLVLDESDTTLAATGTQKQYEWETMVQDMHDDSPGPKTIHISISEPDTLVGGNLFPIWSNESGNTFTIEQIKCWSEDVAGNDANIEFIEVSPTDFTDTTSIDDVTCSNDGTDVDYITDTSFSHATIENGNIIAVNTSADDITFMKCTIKGTYY